MAAARFGVRCAVGFLALFGLIRLPVVERLIILPLADFQALVATWYTGISSPAVAVTAACAGGEIIALCLALVTAYPVRWRSRLIGAAAGVLLISIANTIRIAGLQIAAQSDSLEVVHLYVGPAALTLVVLGYAGVWTAAADRREWPGAPWLPESAWPRFWRLSALLVSVYLALGPWLLTGEWVTTVAVSVVSTTSALLQAAGMHVRAEAAVLFSANGAFVVTAECVMTPLMPLYLAGVLALRMQPGVRFFALLAFAPMFFALAVARLLTVALPAAGMAPPEVLTHAFYQLVAGVLCVAAFAWNSGDRRPGTAVVRTLWALAAAVAVAASIGAPYSTAVFSLSGEWFSTAPAGGDSQRALAILPAYQLALLVALWGVIPPRRLSLLAAGLTVVFLSQVLLLSPLSRLAADDGRASILALRAWGLLLPVLLVSSAPLAVSSFSRLRRRRESSAPQPSSAGGYRRFWEHVGGSFPDLWGAVSTGYYRRSEERLLSESLGGLDSCRLLKTDLWDEAKNTRILEWAQGQGAHTFGVDISEPIIRQAAQSFARGALHAATADVRTLPFADDTFDAVYSMGTVEHFAEYDRALKEIARVLKPSGRAIIGVPNRHDPFLRPLLVALLGTLQLYPYGYELSFSRRGLRRAMIEAGLQVRTETGILFMPGWLRMVELAAYVRWPRLGRVLGYAVRPFMFLDRQFPRLRRHGYLIVAVGTKEHARRTRA